MEKIKELKINPIIKKDLRVSSRSMKLAWELFGYVAIQAGIFLLVFSALSSYRGYNPSAVEMYQQFVTFFPVLAVTQLIIIALAIPIFTASSISGERERGTLDTLLTTTTSYFSIVFGKMMSAVIRIMIFILASIPLMAISFMVGGISWFVLIEFIFHAFVFAILAGSIGVYCSAKCKKTITSLLLSFGIYFLIGGASFVPLIVAAISSVSGPYGSMSSLKAAFMVQLINPIISFLAFFTKRLSSEDIIEDIFDTIFLGNTNVWLFLSVIVQLLLALFFLKRAAKRINPLNEKVVRIK